MPKACGLWPTTSSRRPARWWLPAWCRPDDQVTIITSNGIALRTPVATISQMRRATRGVRIVNAGDSDTVRAMARMLADLAVGDEPETTIAVPVPVRQVVEPEPAPSEALAGVAGDGPAV